MLKIQGGTLTMNNRETANVLNVFASVFEKEGDGELPCFHQQQYAGELHVPCFHQQQYAEEKYNWYKFRKST